MFSCQPGECVVVFQVSGTIAVTLRSNIDPPPPPPKKLKLTLTCVFIERQGELPMAKSIFLKEYDVMAMRKKLAGCNQATRGPDRKDKYDTLYM